MLVILIQSLEEKQRIIAVNDEELKLLRGKLEEISVMRAELFASVKETVEAQLGTTNEQGLPLVEICDNANIIINEAVLFDTAQWTIKPEGKKLLDEFAIAFENILKNPGMREIIDSITVEGHADKTGDEFSNMTLSLNRANAVIRYMFESNPNLLLNYNNYFAAAGYSEFRPIDPGDSAQALAKNRRIEFAIKIKDSTIKGYQRLFGRNGRNNGYRLIKKDNDSWTFCDRNKENQIRRLCRQASEQTLRLLCFRRVGAHMQVLR